MAIVTGTWLTYDSIGIREDLEDTIFQISPTEIPVYSMLDKIKATNTTHEWQTDSLAAAAANAAVEGNDWTYTAPSATSRLSNQCQIFEKTMLVSATMDVVSKAGRNREFVYQARQRGLEMKRDFEFVLMNNQTPDIVRADTDPTEMRPVISWYSTNADRGVGGSDGSASAAVTDGTQRDLDEDLLKTVIRNCWSAGGRPDCIVVGPFNKQRISTFGGNATRYVQADIKKLIAGIAYYESDFGVHEIKPDRFSRERDVHVMDSNYWACAVLRPMRTYDAAKTGDAFKGAIVAEWCLVSRNEAASGIVADVNTA